MATDERNLLDILKFELQFLEKGGYGRSPRQAWRAPRIFEDSPSCPNHGLLHKELPCSECALMKLVPEEYQNMPVPCDFIPLDEAGDTVDSLYRYSSHQELEAVLKGWLRAMIERLEQEQEQTGRTGVQPEQAESPDRLAHCSNPACRATYAAEGGGRFFRFHTETAETGQANSHHVRHFWLCPPCSWVFTMTKNPGEDPRLKFRWRELPEGDHVNELAVKQ